MRVEVLPNPEALRAATVTSPSLSSRAPGLSFAETLGRSSAADSAQPGTPVPSGKAVSSSPLSGMPSSLPAQVVQVARGTKPDVPVDSKLAGSYGAVEVQPAPTSSGTGPGESNNIANAQIGSDLTAQGDANSQAVIGTAPQGKSDADVVAGADVKSAVESTSGAETADRSVKPTPKTGGQKQSKSDGSGSASLVLAMPPEPQLSAALDSTMASMFLPGALPIVLPVAPASAEASAASLLSPHSLAVSPSVPFSDLESSATVGSGTSAPVASGRPPSATPDLAPPPASSAFLASAPLSSTHPSTLDSSQTKTGARSDSQPFAGFPVNNALKAEAAPPALDNLSVLPAKTPVSAGDFSIAPAANGATVSSSPVLSSHLQSAGFSEIAASASNVGVGSIDRQALANGTPLSAKEAAEKIEVQRSAPKGAFDLEGLAVSLKRYPDTQPSISASFKDDTRAKVNRTVANPVFPVSALPSNAVPNNALTGDAPHLHSEPASPVFASKPAASAVAVTSNAVLSASAAAASASYIAASPSEPAPLPNSSSPLVSEPAPAAPTDISKQRVSPGEVSTTQPPATPNAAVIPARSALDFIAAAILQTTPDSTGSVNIGSPQIAPSNGGPAIAESVSAAAPLAGSSVGNSVHQSAANFVPAVASNQASLAPASAASSAKDDPKAAPQAVQGIASQDESAPLQQRKSATSTAHISASASAATAQQTGAAPALVPPASVQNATAPAPDNSGSSAPLPPAHQMLDSAPSVPFSGVVPANASAHRAADAALQMHVGIHTSAFGNVEIRTIVEQNHVGVAIHGERDLARWFSSEVSGLEAGLKSQHLNLTAVDFGSNRSGVQTATSFQQGQPQQNFAQAGGHAAAFSKASSAPESETETEFNPTVALPAQLPGTRVSILA